MGGLALRSPSGLYGGPCTPVAVLQCYTGSLFKRSYLHLHRGIWTVCQALTPGEGCKWDAGSGHITGKRQNHLPTPQLDLLHSLGIIHTVGWGKSSPSPLHLGKSVGHINLSSTGPLWWPW